MPRSRPKLLLLTVPGKCLVWTGSAQGRRTDLVPNVLELAGFISGLRCEHMRTTFATQVLDVSWHIELYIDIWICLIMCFFCICFQPWGGLGAQFPARILLNHGHHHCWYRVTTVDGSRHKWLRRYLHQPTQMTHWMMRLSKVRSWSLQSTSLAL